MKRNLWPLVPVGLLLMMAVTQGILVTSAAGGDAVETDYYRKAVNWDDHMAQEQANRELGWQLHLAAKPLRTDVFLLSLTLNAAGGQPITDAAVTVEAFANARSDRRVSLSLKPVAGGYEAELPVTLYGLWEFRFVVLRKTALGVDERLTWVERQDLLGPSSQFVLPQGIQAAERGAAR